MGLLDFTGAILAMFERPSVKVKTPLWCPIMFYGACKVAQNMAPTNSPSKALANGLVPLASNITTELTLDRLTRN